MSLLVVVVVMVVGRCYTREEEKSLVGVGVG